VSPASHHTVRRDERGFVCATVVTRRVYPLPARDGVLSGGAPASLVAADPDDPVAAGGDLLAVARPGTDVIVSAHAHSVDGPVAAMDVSVAVHDLAAPLRPRLYKRLRVIGDRAVALDPLTGAASFTAPQPFVEMPLSWDRAYGGRDDHARARHVPDEIDELLGTDDLYRYPRNDLGRGYTVSPDHAALSALRLPNVEDPADLLTPARLVLGALHEWPRSPVAAGFGAVPAHWWPRSAWLGMGSGSPLPSADFIEVRTGLVPEELTTCDSIAQLTDRRDRRWFHTAALGLWGETLAGNETVVLTGMHPHRRQVTITLPDERPRVTVRLGGRSLAADAALRTVEIDLLVGTVALVWTASVALADVYGRRDLDGLSHEIDWPQP
jgi:hypothetical protein